MAPRGSKTVTPKVEGTEIVVPGLEIKFMNLTLVGDSPLICHAWSDKAKKLMLDKQMKKANPGREAKDPEADYKASLYPFKSEYGDYGFPAVGFKASAVSAGGRFLEGMTMTKLRGGFHIIGDMVPIEGEPEMREDMVRLNMTADIRYRGQFVDWKAHMPIRFNSRSISVEQIVNLFNTAGFGVGVGEWRPEKDGSYGMFHVESVQ